VTDSTGGSQQGNHNPKEKKDGIRAGEKNHPKKKLSEGTKKGKDADDNNVAPLQNHNGMKKKEENQLRKQPLDTA